MTILFHGNDDWCHVCGERGNAMADIRYPDNAEHDKEDVSRYTRICEICLLIAVVTIDEGNTQ